MLQEFKAFIFRGNLVDLAVAFILGLAFATVVSAFTDGIVMAFIAAIVGEPSFNNITIEIGDGVILIGTFLTALVNLLLVGAVLFLILKAIAKAQRPKGDPAADAAVASDEAIILTEIRDLLRSQSRP